MDMNQKMLMELAEQLGLEEKGQSAVKEAARVAGGYKNKSEDELLKEIQGLKRTMKSSPAQFQKQLAAIMSLRAMMNQEQQERLDRVVALLEQD